MVISRGTLGRLGGRPKIDGTYIGFVAVLLEAQGQRRGREVLVSPYGGEDSLGAFPLLHLPLSAFCILLYRRQEISIWNYVYLSINFPGAQPTLISSRDRRSYTFLMPRSRSCWTPSSVTFEGSEDLKTTPRRTVFPGCDGMGRGTPPRSRKFGRPGTLMKGSDSSPWVVAAILTAATGGREDRRVITGQEWAGGEQLETPWIRRHQNIQEVYPGKRT